MNEKTLENKIKKHLTDNKHYHFKVHGSIFMRSGIPDIIACINGYFVGIEVKNPNGKGVLSTIQQAHLKKIVECGGFSIMVDNYNDYLKFYEYIKNKVKLKSDC